MVIGIPLEPLGIPFCARLVQAVSVDNHPHKELEPLVSRTAIAGCGAFALVAAITMLFLVAPLAAVATGVLALIMALITITDLKHFIIPNALSFPAVVLGVLANIAVFHPDEWMAGLTESLLGAVLAGGSFYLLRAMWFRLRGFEGLGLGDVKLAAVAGAWLGPALLAPACLASAVAGIAAVGIMAMLPGRRITLRDEIPFGSFIAPMILLFWIWRILDAAANWSA